MIDFAQVLTQAEILLDSDLLRTFISKYFFLLLFLFVLFWIIYYIDKYEYLNNKQKSFFEFKHKQFFIIMYSKEKHIISKKIYN